MNAKLKPVEETTSSKSTLNTNNDALKRLQALTAKRDPPKRVVFGFADDKPIQIELDATTNKSPVDLKSGSVSVDSEEKPFIVMATSVSSSFSSSVGRSARRADRRVGRRSDITMTKAKRKGTINSSRKDRINVFKRFFPKRHFLHRF